MHALNIAYEDCMCVCICSTNVGILNELSLSSSHASRAISTALFTYTLCKCISMFGCVCKSTNITVFVSVLLWVCVHGLCTRLVKPFLRKRKCKWICYSNSGKQAESQHPYDTSEAYKSHSRFPSNKSG